MPLYIMFNTKLKTAAKNGFEENFFKLMDNTVFVRTMENIRSHKNVKIATS